ncbi:cobalt ECF transporter T component CbiQ [Methanobacterium sp.]|jgi:cobalt/nickel transport system permease protein|uniref:cobalt ECF transporter T component CbiQ n=1 Tax=Methanobacterium sp. TaxID=2164 RepID=UPI0031593AB0
MFENTLDGYAHSNGLRTVNTYLKVIFAILTMVVNLISTSPVVPFIVLLILTYLIIFKAKIPYKFYLKFFAVPFIFAFITFIFMAIFFGVGAHVLDLGIFNLAVTADGFNLGLLVFARMLGGFSCLAFLALTTPMTELFSILERLKIPSVVVEITMLMYRYIFVFLDEAINMYHSQETRLGYSSMKRAYNSMGMLASNLFIKTWIKGEQIYVSMESRCYNGSMKTMGEYRSIRSIGIRNLTLLVLFEITLSISVYLTGNFNIF